LSAVVTIVSVLAVSGFAVTASIARTTVAGVASVLAVCVNTSTLVAPASMLTLANAGHAQRRSAPKLPAVACTLLMLSTLPVHVTARSS
jgi:hypothetical protein